MGCMREMPFIIVMFLYRLVSVLYLERKLSGYDKCQINPEQKDNLIGPDCANYLT